MPAIHRVFCASKFINVLLVKICLKRSLYRQINGVILRFSVVKLKRVRTTVCAKCIQQLLMVSYL